MVRYVSHFVLTYTLQNNYVYVRPPRSCHDMEHLFD
jgi:hypothetical protein